MARSPADIRACKPRLFRLETSPRSLPGVVEEHCSRLSSRGSAFGRIKRDVRRLGWSSSKNTLVYARSALNARSEAATTDYRYQRHVQAPGFIRSLARASLLSLLKSKVVACFRARDELISTNID